MKENDFPALYKAADSASKDAQKHFFKALGASLVCLILASILSVIACPNTLFAIGQVIVLLGSLGLTIYLAYKKPQRVWYSTRALAESIKTMVWRYMMQAEPYDIDHSEAERHLIQGLRKILYTNKQACAHMIDMSDLDQITDKMIQNRNLALVNRKQLYIEERINDQLTWYRKKAKLNSHYSTRWFWGLIVINIVAILFALLRIAFPDRAHWPTDILITVAGAVMAWLQTKRFQELATSYALTAYEISLLRAGMPNDEDEQSFSIFVADSENAFSREHIQWQARRDGD